MVGLLRYGGISGVLAAGIPLTFLVDDIEPAERAFAARIIGEVGINNFYQPLLALLSDEDVQVRLAALAAAGQVGHARLLPLVINNLADTATHGTCTDHADFKNPHSSSFARVEIEVRAEVGVEPSLRPSTSPRW